MGASSDYTFNISNDLPAICVCEAVYYHEEEPRSWVLIESEKHEMVDFYCYFQPNALFDVQARVCFERHTICRFKKECFLRNNEVNYFKYRKLHDSVG